MRTTNENRRRVPWWLVIVVIAAALVVYIRIPKPIEVNAAEVRRGVLQLFLSATGVVEGEVSDVSARITARISRLYVEEGDRVAQGQVLAQLESTDIQTEVNRQRAGVRAAEEEVASLQRNASAESGQLQAAVTQARANLEAARANLRQLQAGTRREDIASQRAVVAQARAQAEDARRRLDRAQQLYQRGAISAQDLDTARANYEIARSQVTAQEEALRRLEAGPRTEEIQAARAQVSAAEAALRQAQSSLGLTGARQRDVAAARARLNAARAALRSALAQLAFTTVRSPISGVVARKHKEVGETVPPTDPIYTVANLQNTWVVAEVDAEDVAAVAPGQRAEITLDAYPGREAEGVVTRVSEIAEPKEVGRVRAKIVRARIKVQNSTIPLRPGMEVNVTGSLPAGAETLLAPNDAVVRVGDQDSAYVIDGGVARLRRIEIGQSNFEYTQVLSGLREGELVAVTMLDQLTDGARVRIVD